MMVELDPAGMRAGGMQRGGIRLSYVRAKQRGKRRLQLVVPEALVETVLGECVDVSVGLDGTADAGLLVLRPGKSLRLWGRTRSHVRATWLPNIGDLGENIPSTECKWWTDGKAVWIAVPGAFRAHLERLGQVLAVLAMKRRKRDVARSHHPVSSVAVVCPRCGERIPVGGPAE
jgi:hypothetical protein